MSEMKTTQEQKPMVALPCQRSQGHFKAGDEVLVYVPKGSDPMGEYCFERGKVVDQDADGGYLRVQFGGCVECFRMRRATVMLLTEAKSLAQQLPRLHYWVSHSEDDKADVAKRSMIVRDPEEVMRYVIAFTDLVQSTPDWLAKS